MGGQGRPQGREQPCCPTPALTHLTPSPPSPAHLYVLDEHGGELLRPLRVRSRLLREAQELPRGQPGVDAERDGAEQWLCLLAPGGRSPRAQRVGAAGWVSFRDLLRLPLSHWPACVSPAPVSQPFLPPSLTHPSAHPSAYPSILTSVQASFPPCPPFSFSSYTSISPSAHPSLFPPTHSFIRLSSQPPTHPSIRLSIHLPIHASSLSAHLSTPHKPVHFSLFSYSSICHLPAHLSLVVRIFCPRALLLCPVWLPVTVHHLPVCPSALPSTCLAILLTDQLPCFIPHLSDQSLGTHLSVHLLVHPLALSWLIIKLTRGCLVPG